MDNQLNSVTVEGDPASLGSHILRYNPLIETISYNGSSYTASEPNAESCYVFSSGTITDFLKADLANIKTNSQACINPSLNIPSSIGGVAVTAIANSAFSGDSQTSVTSQASASEDCSNIDNARLLPSSDFTAPSVTTASGTVSYMTLGGLDFTLSCTNPGSDASVSLALAAAVAEPGTDKVYKKTASGVIDITDQTTVTNQNGKTTISYNLTDGGELDDDETVNGTITDPNYVAVPSSDPIVQNDSTTDGGELADTGTSLWLATAVAAAMLLATGMALRVARR